jgi:phosphoribosylformimino-5-aminoimidazole carboxamide ribotide isomerase
MIIPCIDLMDGKVVQLVQGRKKALEGRSPDDQLALFAAFPQLQVIDLDAAMGRGANTAILNHIASRALVRAGGGVRTVDRARELLEIGAHRVIVGTAAFGAEGPNFEFLSSLRAALGATYVTIALDSKDGFVVVKGWQEKTRWKATDLIPALEPYCSGFLCTYVDKEGMMQGTDLGWFGDVRSRTGHELIAAGGITTMEDVRALSELGIHCAIGMSIYTGRLSLDELAELNAALLRSEYAGGNCGLSAFPCGR